MASVESSEEGTSFGFCIYVDSLLTGSVPVERRDDGNPATYSTREAAERQIAEYTLERLQEYLAGERSFADAMTVEEYIVEVDILPDGSISDEDGNLFGKDN